MALVRLRSERSGRTELPLKNVKKWPPKQNIALFLHSSTMTVAPYLNYDGKLN